MKIALFSDIHANLPALEAVLADVDRRQPDAVYCLGDLVGYAPWPNEVIAAIRRRRISTIAGNYDEGVGLASENCGCAYKTEADKALGAQSIAYTNSLVKPEERAFLRGLPRHLRIEFGGKDGMIKLLLVHGSPRKINEYLFADRPEASLLRMLEQADTDVLFFGHTHKPFHRKLAYGSGSDIKYRHAINIGSVGKPKDGDPRACYLLLTVDGQSSLADPESIGVEFVRVAYDVEQAALAVEESPLPNEYADMLRKGY